MERFKTIGIIGNPASSKTAETLHRLASHLIGRGVRVLVDRNCAELEPANGQTIADREQLGQESDLVVVIGGDGTFLDAARSVAPFKIPLLGVNLGRLGFMVDVAPDRMTTTLDEVLAGEFQVETRFLLDGAVIREGSVVHQGFALNDLVINKRDVARMIDFDTYVDDHFVSEHRADGLIVSTPTGSTAYALSGGGPVVHPSLEALLLVPICPHTLSDRPLVVGANASVEIEISARNANPVQATWDGQTSIALETHDRVRVRRSPFDLTFIHPRDHDYFRILRTKLGWGGDRNRRN
ncbi:MAG: NAD(+) kinase [Pseudomonadota bacterium]|nr:NAD(+) kinase [Pseudomonadota bacterium]